MPITVGIKPPRIEYENLSIIANTRVRIIPTPVSRSPVRREKAAKLNDFVTNVPVLI